MRYSVLAVAAALAIETAALACSCLATDDPAQLRELAADAAENAIALVEAEALTSYQATGTGERMRVQRTIAGRAPAEFLIERRGIPSSASCDVLYETGQRTVVILYPSDTTAGALPVYRTSGLCTVHLLDKPVFRDAVAAGIGPAPANGGERG